MSVHIEDSVAAPLAGKRVCFVGRLGGINRREAQQLVRSGGGWPVDASDEQLDMVVIGADELPPSDDELLSDTVRTAAAEGRLEIITEDQLWQRLGLVETEQHVRRLYTPAMLAQLLRVPIAVVRRWHRRGLIVPARVVKRLPYFDFQEVATARRLAQLLAAGATPASIERKLAQLARYVPWAERPLAQLSVIIEGRQFLLRQGEGLIEPGGQLRFDFEALEAAAAGRDAAPADGRFSREILSLEQLRPDAPPTPHELARAAAGLEEQGQLDEAADMYRAALIAGGPTAENCFHLAELLYRVGETGAARERYAMAVELDPDFVEARANLGCVLAESGRHEQAAAAFQGALAHHPDYPDVHYHLARTLDELGRDPQAEVHWRAFLNLASSSPWAEEARTRLGIIFE